MKISTVRITYLMGVNLMTQQNLAAAAGVSRATINNTLIKGSCSTGTAGKIASALNVGVADIVEEVKA